MKHPKSPIRIPENELEPININGLKGRLLHIKSSRNKKFVLLAGQHTAHERIYSLAHFLSEYGEVYSPDLPGFGGMDSFYKIGKKPTYDNYADYIYSFLKSKKLRKDVWFFTISFSTQCLSRMYQKFPGTVKWSNKSVGFVGFTGASNFKVSRWYKTWLYALIYPMSTKIGSIILRLIIFNPLSIRIMVTFFSLAKAKMQSDGRNLKKDMIKMEIYLWTINHGRTHATTAINMLRDDIRNYSDKKIDTTIYNIITDNDQYFDQADVQKAFLELYKDYKPLNIELDVHTPSIVESKDEFKKMMSREAVQLLDS